MWLISKSREIDFFNECRNENIRVRGNYSAECKNNSLDNSARELIKYAGSNENMIEHVKDK